MKINTSDLHLHRSPPPKRVAARKKKTISVVTKSYQTRSKKNTRRR